MLLLDYCIAKARSAGARAGDGALELSVEAMVVNDEGGAVGLQRALDVKDLEQQQGKNLSQLASSTLACFVMPRVAIGLQVVNTAKIWALNPDSKAYGLKQYLCHYDLNSFQAAFFFLSISRLGMKF